MATIRIVTDNGCDLPEALLAEHDVISVPLEVRLGPAGAISLTGLSAEEFWKIAIETPSPVPDAPPTLLATVPLREEAMSVSGVWGNSFQVGGRTYGHIIDPRTGEPAIGTVLAAVVLPSATETDALSTALLTLGAAGHDAIARLRPSMRTLVVSESGGQLQVEAKGIEVRFAA